MRWRWSPLFETDPIGGPDKQPIYANAVLVVDGQKLAELKPSESAALLLLEKFLDIEKTFGRDRKSTLIPWGPRSLDIDFLAWGGLQVEHPDLILPHPRLIERSFVVVPLAAALTCDSNAPRRISPQKDWPN